MRHVRIWNIRWTIFIAPRHVRAGRKGPKYVCPSLSTRRVTNARGQASPVVTLMYGYVLSSRRRML